MIPRVYVQPAGVEEHVVETKVLPGSAGTLLLGTDGHTCILARLELERRLRRIHFGGAGRRLGQANPLCSPRWEGWAVLGQLFV